VIDIVPTILEAAGVAAPAAVDGIAQKPIEGVSMAPPRQEERGRPVEALTQYFEMFGNRDLSRAGGGHL
jgi:arylsulfatase